MLFLKMRCSGQTAVGLPVAMGAMRCAAPKNDGLKKILPGAWVGGVTDVGSKSACKLKGGMAERLEIFFSAVVRRRGAVHYLC